MKTFRVIIAGSRYYCNYRKMVAKCDAILANKLSDPDCRVVIVSGCAQGADALGERYAWRHRLKVERYPADWEGLGKSAGPVRNEQMAQNAEDMQGEFGEMFPELIQSDPIGMRNVLMQQMAPLMQATGGSYKTIDGHFFVPDSTVCVAFISPQFSATNTGQGSELFENLNELIEAFAQAHPGVKISYHGTPASGYYNSSTIKNDLTTTIAWSLVIVLIVLFLCATGTPYLCSFCR